MARARQQKFSGSLLGFGWADYADDEYTEGSPYSVTAEEDTPLPNNAQSGVRSQEPSDISDAGGFYVPAYLVVDDASGFTVGETITGGTSGDTAVVVSLDTTNNRIYIESYDTVDDVFQDGETITGGTSAETAVVSGTVVPGKITGRNGDGINVLVDFKVKPTTGASTRIDVWVDIGGAVGELYRRTVTLSKGQSVEHGFTMSFAGYTLDTWESNGGVPYIRASAAVDIYDIRAVLTRTHKA